MSQSSNYNCISSDCARVVYREYLPPVVRWRYPNEEWQEIVADDYTLVQRSGQCNTLYNVTGTFTNGNARYGSSVDQRQFRASFRGNFEYLNQSIGQLRIYYEFSGLRYVVPRDVELNVQVSLTDEFVTNPNVSVLYGLKNSVEITDIVRADGLPDDCSDCIFTVYKNGEEIYSETRDTCPEVEKLPCRLDDIPKEIKIEKTPYLSAIEVTQVDNDAERIKGVPFPLQGVGKAPDECWNIYRNEIFDPFPSGDADDPNEPAFGDYIDQICSVTGCPPPDYEVICDCNEQCPNGTCGVFCGEYLCCYDSTGKSVKAIHYSDIPDFGIPDNTVGLNDLGGNFA